MIIGISGISGSERPLLPKKLSSELPHSEVLFWDDYEDSSEYPSDYIEWFNNGQDYSSWKVPKLASFLKEKQKCKNHIIFDAPLGYLHEETGQYIDYLIYLDTPLDIALARRLLRDRPDYERELQEYLSSSRPLYCEPEKNKYDLRIDGTLEINEQLFQIKQKLYFVFE